MTNPLLARFIPEARELISSSSTGLLKLEKAPSDADTVNEVFRAVHTLKGSSGLFDVPALTRLVHVAEDLLGAIRAEQLVLDSNLVDELLASLDQVGTWIDHLEASEDLPANADGISSAMAKSLRGYFPSLDAAPVAAGPAAAAATGTAPAGKHDDIARFTPADRRAAFDRIAAGEPVVLVEYCPAETCFFNGTDPLALMLNTPGVLSVVAEPVAAVAPPVDLDPYRCNLRFVLLAAASASAVENHLRYELDHVGVTVLRPTALIHITGRATDGPVWDDFREDALRLLAAGDPLGIRARIRTMVELAAPDLAAVSALGWLDAVLECAVVGPGVIAALIAATRSGVFVAPADDAVVPAAPTPSERARTLAHDIIAVQRRNLAQPTFDAAALRAAGDALACLTRSLHRDDLDAVIAATVVAGLDEMSFAPLRDLLDRLDADIAPPGVTETAPLPDTPIAEPPTKTSPTAAGIVAAGAAEHPDPARGAVKMLKVDQAKIDLLMNLIGELVVSKNSLPFLAKRAEDVHKCRELSHEIKDKYAVIDRLSQEMQSVIMQVRMLPVSDVFDRFPRLIRDISRKLEKSIDLTIEGGDTAADKTIIEALGDPLLHIVRNSLDHGVELPAQRLAAGKPPRATITLSAFQEADQVVIEVSDDGRGIDPAKIRTAAVGKGVIGRAEADALSDQEAINLVFRPGFSTAAEVSDLSGRGVGMDVVRTVVEKLGGRVTLTSRVGEGSQTRLQLPLSMAVTRVMLVEAAGSLYGVPMDLIVETVRVAAERIHTIKQAEAFTLRDRLIPLVRMASLLQVAARPRAADEAEAVLVCRVDGRLVGLVIDEFRVGMDVVLKPLEGIVAGLRGFSGTTLLGDGRVLLVLDLKEFF